MRYRFAAEVVREVTPEMYYVQRKDGDSSERGRLYVVEKDKVDPRATRAGKLRNGDIVEIELQPGAIDVVVAARPLEPTAAAR
jgi:hypothetical protein